MFAAADYYGPVTSDWELEAADEHLYRTAPRLRQALGLPYPRPRRWPKEGHLESLRRSGRFRFVKEVLLHSEEGAAPSATCATPSTTRSTTWRRCTPTA